MLTKSPEWTALQKEQEDLSTSHMVDLFEQSADRAKSFTIEYDGLFVDYSKNIIEQSTIEKLISLAKAQDLEGWRDKMFAGDPINTTENRAVLHTALRATKESKIIYQGKNVVPDIYNILQKMEGYTNAVHSGDVRGATGKTFETIVNIGIGGSDLGPLMVCEALKPWQKNNIPVRFVSNIDGEHLNQALKDLNPETTLFIVASKTFTTQETLTNAETAKSWLIDKLGSDENVVQSHFIALSTNLDAVKKFGISEDNMFPFEDWVGGRYSLWSAIGLSICLSVGFENFRKLLDGAHSMDHHFQNAPLEENIPVILGLLGVWHRNFWNYPAHAVLPYSQLLHRFPAFLQQLDMESNGKFITRDGRKTDYNTGPIVFGEPGTNGQHAFYQLIHQGTTIIPCDFIAPINAEHNYKDHHKKLLANMVAQSQALMTGRHKENQNIKAEKQFTGNRPSNTILLNRLTPYSLGQLIALYEHKVFVQGIIWNINSFDQWGVELGKELTKKILGSENKMSNMDSSTASLLSRINL